MVRPKGIEKKTDEDECEKNEEEEVGCVSESDDDQPLSMIVGGKKKVEPDDDEDIYAEDEDETDDDEHVGQKRKHKTTKTRHKKRKKRPSSTSTDASTSTSSKRKSDDDYECSIPKAVFQRIVSDILHSIRPDFKMEAEARELLHEFTEIHTIELFSNINIVSRYRGAQTASPDDLLLLRAVQSPCVFDTSIAK
jgi:histone H3/H4